MTKIIMASVSLIIGLFLYGSLVTGSTPDYSTSQHIGAFVLALIGTAIVYKILSFLRNL